MATKQTDAVPHQVVVMAQWVSQGFPDTKLGVNDATGGVRWEGEYSKDQISST
jgi:hypothetical protein